MTPAGAFFPQRPRRIPASGSAARFWALPSVAADGLRRPATDARWRSGRLQVAAIRFALAVAFAAAFCGIAAAQGGGWAAVEGIAPGSRVEVRLSPHGIAKGTVASVSASGIDVQKSDGSMRQIPKVQIAKFYLLGKAHKLRDGVIGAAAAGTAGAVYAYAATPKQNYSGFTGELVPNRVSPMAVALWGVAGGMIGAVIGAIIGSHHSKTLVYRRASSPRGQAPASSGNRPSQGPLVHSG